MKIIERSRVDDSIRREETRKAVESSIADSIEAKRLVDSADRADKQADKESDIYLEQERIYNKKIKDEIKNTNNTDVDRIARVRILLAKQRQLKQRQYGNDTAKQ